MSKAPVALITGITGQDGSYLTELLLGKGYDVHGIVRRSSLFNRSRIEHIRSNPEIYEKRLFLHYADLTDATTLRRVLAKVQPREFYHLAGQSHVGLSFEIPESTCEETAMATLSLLEICRDLPHPPRFYHAASSEVFGSPSESTQTEETAFRPVTPYGCAKAFATNLCRVYRESHGIHACSGIMYNHESPRRGESFVTRKICAAAAGIAAGSLNVLELGNLDSARDWGYAPEYVEAMYLMLQQNVADDFVLGTGRATTVRDFAQAAFRAMGMEIEFEGAEASETGRDVKTGRTVLRVNPKFFRPADPTSLVGDASKARQLLGWEPRTAGVKVAEALALAEAAALGV